MTHQKHYGQEGRIVVTTHFFASTGYHGVVIEEAGEPGNPDRIGLEKYQGWFLYGNMGFLMTDQLNEFRAALELIHPPRD